MRAARAYGVRQNAADLQGSRPELADEAARGNGNRCRRWLLLLRVLEELGFRVWFRYQKYREEFAHEDVTVAIDETPVGTFVEIEGSEQRHPSKWQMRWRGSPDDYLLDSYRGLFVKHCQTRGLPLTDMLFEES